MTALEVPQRWDACSGGGFEHGCGILKSRGRYHENHGPKKAVMGTTGDWTEKREDGKFSPVLFVGDCPNVQTATFATAIFKYPFDC